jgi:hypothetical protein
MPLPTSLGAIAIHPLWVHAPTAFDDLSRPLRRGGFQLEACYRQDTKQKASAGLIAHAAQ